MQHAFRTTVLGLSRFKCAANFDVIFFPSHCLKPLALFIIRALWSEQHGNNVSRRHTPSDGPLTALRQFLSFFFPLSLFLPLSFCLLSQSSHFLHPFVSSPSLSSPWLFTISPYSSPSLLKFTPTLFYFIILCVSICCLTNLTFLSLRDCIISPHVWPLISNSIINWSLISWWLIQGGS